MSLLVLLVTSNYPASAHTVEIAEDVGGTIHIEPNDTPRAGENSLAWIALTRKGGKVLPLEECNCQLAVYSKPLKPGTPPLLTPSLKPVSAEKYQGIPGADITFPKPGAYLLQLTGKPQAGADFKPFELKFDLTVAAGVAKPTAAKPEVQPQVASVPPTVEQSNNQYLIPGIVIASVAGLGGVWVLLQRKKQV
ncbi:MAG: hypothetical protein VKL59_21710 [Nostocaceae cyanobacterium]|nr:hypothetical protein [Nostocaceae cyanobacterium]